MAKEEEISENLLKVLKGLNKKETEDKISVSKIKKKFTAFLKKVFCKLFRDKIVYGLPNKYSTAHV